MEKYFSKFRKGIIGINHKINTPNNEATRLIYADWTASGRMYQPIENNIQKNFLPYVANTHTDTNRDIEYILNAISELAKNHSSWIKNYEVNLFNSEIKSKTYNDKIEKK